MRIIDIYVPGDRAQTGGRTSSIRWQAVRSDGKTVERAATKTDLFKNLVVTALRGGGTVWQSLGSIRNGTRTAWITFADGDCLAVPLRVLENEVREGSLRTDKRASDLVWEIA